MDLVGELTVTRVRALTPRMLRVSFGAPAGLTHWPDQQIKLCFPRGGSLHLPAAGGGDMRWYQAYLAIPEQSRPWLRSFTVRRHDPDRNELDIDFVLHGDAGPAVRWARTAAPGQVLGRYGPAEAYRTRLRAGDWYLFAGDETAVPAIGSLLESLPSAARALVFLEVADPAEEQSLSTVSTPDATDVCWLFRSAGASLLDAVRALSFPEGAVSAWLAGEAGTVRALRRHLVAQRGVPKRSIEFAGYWRRTLTQDDAPTEQDMAEARERVALAGD
jgi:NADPH-dependent ferric siderophore reductase